MLQPVVRMGRRTGSPIAGRFPSLESATRMEGRTFGPPPKKGADS
jgi:hypothetical protein